jgi:hypothetical protein
MTTRRRKRRSPEQIVRKLRDADALLNAGKDLAAVLQALEVSEAGNSALARASGGRDPLHRVGLPVGKRLRRELPQPTVR